MLARRPSIDRESRQNVLVNTNEEPYLDLSADGYGVAVVMPGKDAIAWTAAPPTASDRWVSVSRTTEGIVATSWHGIRAILDPESGRLLASTFTK